jgi:hypothetical protein
VQRGSAPGDHPMTATSPGRDPWEGAAAICPGGVEARMASSPVEGMLRESGNIVFFLFFCYFYSKALYTTSFSQSFDKIVVPTFSFKLIRQKFSFKLFPIFFEIFVTEFLFQTFCV